MHVTSSIETLREFIMNDLHWAGKKEHLTPDYPLIENHVLDSLGLFSLVTFVETQFGVEVQDDELVPENFGTLGAIADLIQRKRAAG
jgi:acyl carrier protein